MYLKAFAIAFATIAAAPASADEPVTITGPQGLDDVRLKRLVWGTTVDLSDAEFQVAISKTPNPTASQDCNEGAGQINRYPFAVEHSPGVQVSGGLFAGEAPLASDWLYTYCNSAAIRIEESPGAILTGHRLRRVWDGIRLDEGSDDFRISGVWMSEVRDDCIENDELMSGVIRDSLFDGCFAGISVTPPDPLDRSPVVKIDKVLMRMQQYIYRGEIRHALPIKIKREGALLQISDTILAVSTDDVVGGENTQLMWDSILRCSNNALLWLGEGEIPEGFQKAPPCFDIVSGDAAWELWERERQNWIAAHPEVARFPADG